MSTAVDRGPEFEDGVAALLAGVLRLQLAERRIEGRIGLEHGLSQSDVLALALLVRKERQTVGQIASDLALNPGSASSLVTRLTRAGLVRRVANEADGRSVLIEATEAGLSLVRSIGADYAAAIRAAGEQVGAQCLRTAARVLDQTAVQLDHAPGTRVGL